MIELHFLHHLFKSDLRKALLGTWVIASAILMAAAISPWILPAEMLWRLFPVCPAKLSGTLCPLCGMTTAWIAISAGDLGSALQSNRFSVALWTVCVANFTLMKTAMLFLLLRKPCN